MVAFIGASTYDKGAFTLLLAIADLNRSGCPTWLACAGPFQDKLAAFLAHQPTPVQAALAGRVCMLGVVDEVTKRRLLAACDLLALPSRVDSFGIVVIEAWLYGKPVIAANIGGPAELVQPGETGELVPFGDVPALARTIRQIIAVPGLADRMGTNGRQRVLVRYTWERSYAQLRRVYSAILP
jgi:glycogen(starch) synthase